MSSERERVSPRKLSLSNPAILLATAQIIVVKIVKALSAAHVIPHAHFRLVPLPLEAVEFGQTNCLRACAAKQDEQREKEDDATHAA